MATRCDNCGESCGPDDLFCESCGYDFITGSLPASDGQTESARDTGSVSSEAPTSPAGPDSDASAASSAAVAAEARAPSLVDDASQAVPRVIVTVGIDRSYFEAMVTEGEVDFPDPMPPGHELELFGRELHIGRTSESRAVYPNIDVEALTGDPAVSTRHGVLRVADDGSHTVADVGSTNGTFVDDFSADPITQGVPVALKDDSIIYLGAWTTLTVKAG